MRQLLLAIMLIPLPALALSIAPPTTPPVGWENAQTPGFEPSIESVVVAMGEGEYQTPEAMAAVWEHWSIGAVDVLRELEQQERWKRYHHDIRRLRMACPLPQFNENVRQTLETLGLKQDLTDDEQRRLGELLNFYLQTRSEDRDTLIERFLEDGNDFARNWALRQRIHELIEQRSEESLARAETLIHGNYPEQPQEYLLQRIEDYRGYARAQQPMQAVAE